MMDDALRAANDKLLDELAKKNPLSKEIIKSRHFVIMVTFGILNQSCVIVLKLLLCRLLLFIA
jgi:hypothetical protein